jgi:ribosomal protein S18 acetylase RimI-like enzyme
MPLSEAGATVAEARAPVRRACEPAGVAALPSHEVEAAARSLARAFRDNPLNLAVIGGDPQRRLRCNRAGMRQLLPVARRHALVLRAGATRPDGVLIATPPGAYPLPAAPLGARLRALVTQGVAVQVRWGRVFEHLDRLHPPEPHWYLATLGVAPAARSRGIARALLRVLLDRTDREALPCYLETDRSENVVFYAAAGFAVDRESRVLGVPIWHMRRSPQTP